jgi:hypothetical protein
MKLWLLRPVNEASEPWAPWFDCTFGFVVRGETETAARTIAAEQAGDEGPAAWLSPDTATCTELRADGSPGVIMMDYNPTDVSRASPRQAEGKRIDQAHKLSARH